MSTLMSRLGRRFREKPKRSSVDLPPLPTAREILEDMEACPPNDPVIRLATLIQKKGRQSSLMDNDFLEECNAEAASKLSFLAPYQLIEQKTEDLHGGGGGGGGGRRRGSLTGPKASKVELEQLNEYNKLKQFLLLFERAEGILEELEPQLIKVHELNQKTAEVELKKEPPLESQNEEDREGDGWEVDEGAEEEDGWEVEDVQVEEVEEEEEAHVSENEISLL